MRTSRPGAGSAGSRWLERYSSWWQTLWWSCAKRISVERQQRRPICRRYDELNKTEIEMTVMTRLAVCLIVVVASARVARSEVKFGIDVLRDEQFASLAGKRVGLIASPSSVDQHLDPTS